MEDQYAQDEAGNIWLVDAQGNAVRLVQAAGQGQQQMRIGTPSPKAGYDAQRAQAEAARAVAEAPYAADRAKAEAAKAEADAAKARLEASQGVQPTSPALAKAQQVRAAQNMLAQLDQQEELFRRSFMSGNLWNTLGEYNPLDPNVQNFNAYSANLLPYVKQFMRVPGEGSQSDRDANAYQRLLPSSGVYDSTNIIRFNNIRDAANAVLRANGVPERKSRFFDAQGGLLGQVSDNNQPSIAAGPSGGTTGGGIGGAGGQPPMGPRGEPLLAPDEMVQFGTDGAGPVTGKRLAPDQEAQVLAAARAGDVGQVASLLQRFTGAPADRAQIQSAINNYRKNPKGGISLGYGAVDEYAQSEDDRKRFGDKLPQAMRERTGASTDVWGRGLANGMSAGLADYAAALGNMATGGGSFSDNLQMEQARTEADARLHPDENMLSTIIGGAGGAALGEGALARMLPGAIKVAAPALADVGYGTLAGYTSSAPGDRGRGALAGALLGGLGGVGGRALTSGAGKAIQGITDPAKQLLRSEGVRLSLGQLLGGAAKRLEDASTSIPFVGDAARSIRAQGIGDFDAAAFRRQADTAGQVAKDSIGALGVEDAFDNASRAYDSALGGVNVTADAPFVNEVRTKLGQMAQIPRTGPEAAYLVNDRLGTLFNAGNGTLNGATLQDALQGLAKADFGTDAMGTAANNAVGGVEDALTSLVSRQAPDVMPAYGRAKQSYREASILRDAVNRARNGSRSGEVEQFMPSQLADAAAANSKRYGGTQGTTKQPFYDLARAGQQVLPSSVPDSGTAGRLLPALAISGGYGADQGAGALGVDTGGGLTNLGLLAAALSAPNTKPGRFLLDKILAARPQRARTLGAVIGKGKRLGGVFGAGTGAALAPGLAPILLPGQ